MSQWQTAGKVRMTPRGIWSASTAYVVLDCVSNTDKTAYYVAKQNVPAGTLLTNTEYWEVVNDISDIVSQLTNEIERLEDIVALGYPAVSGTGKFMNAEGTIDAPLSELTIYGKSVQSDATPSPSAPATIVTAGENGSIEMHSTNGSLFDPAFLLGASGWSVNGNVYSGDAYALWQRFNSTHWISDVPSGTRLTISGRASIPSAVSYPRFVFNYADGTSSNVNLTASSEFAIFSGTSEVGKDVDYVIFTYSGNTSATMSLTDLRISIGTTDSGRGYIAPVISAIPTPNGLPGIPVSSGGNYTDTDEHGWLCDTISLEAGVYTKRCGVVTLDGSENWQKGISFYLDGNDFYAVFPGAYANAPGLCNMFIVVTGGGSNNGTARFAGNGHQFLCYTSVASTVSEWKAVLNNTHMTIVYPLAAPVVTQLTTAQLTALKSLRGKKGLTNLYSTDSTQPEFKAKVYIDIPTYINSLNNASTSSLNASLSSTLNSPNSLSLTNNLEEENTAEEETPEESTELTEEGTET